MSPLDKEALQSKIARIRRNLRELKRLGKLPYKKYIQEDYHTAVAERLLHISIEAMLDIGSHIIAEEGLGEPLEYRNVFSILVKAKILPKNKEEDFVNLTGLRNRIVHLYDTIDHKRIHSFFQHNLNDFEIFIKKVTQYLAS